MSEGALQPDGSGYAAALVTPEGRALVEALGPRQRRDIRAQMAGLLAGPVAERIFRGEAAPIAVEAGRGDAAKAWALAALLGDPAEFAHAQRLAEAALREPARWAQVAGPRRGAGSRRPCGGGHPGLSPAADPGLAAGTVCRSGRVKAVSDPWSAKCTNPSMRPEGANLFARGGGVEDLPLFQGFLQLCHGHEPSGRAAFIGPVGIVMEARRKSGLASRAFHLALHHAFPWKTCGPAVWRAPAT